MRASVTKSFTFHASHQIPNHDGMCRNLHGHTYTLEITVKGVVNLKDEQAPDHGMVCDFGDLKKVYKEAIEPHVEHQHLNHSLSVPVTTAEVLAAWCWNQFAARGITLHRVRLWETPTSYAQIEQGDLI